MASKSVRFFKFLFSSRAVFFLFSEIILIVLISLTVLSIFLKIGYEIFEKEFFLFDSALINYIYGFRSPLTTEFMLVITFLGSWIFLLIGPLIVAVYLFAEKRKDVVIYLVTLYSGILLNLVLKLMFQRPRPSLSPLVSESTYSFPSGHAMNSFVFFALLTYFVFSLTRNMSLRLIVLMFSIIIVILIGISRIYLGAHYPSDVLAGYVAGFLWLLSVILFEKTIIFERLYKLFKK